MSFSNLTLMRETRQLLSPYWGLGVLVAFVYSLIVGAPGAITPIIGDLVSFCLSGPLTLGFVFFSFAITREGSPKLSQLFDGFQFFGKSFLAYLCYLILIVVGLFLLIVPGIIASLGFSMTFFIMADQPELSFSECMEASWKMTKGYRLKYLGLNIRFIPWYLLGLLCLGIGVLLVIPWHQVTLAKFYEEIKNSPSS